MRRQGRVGWICYLAALAVLATFIWSEVRAATLAELRDNAGAVITLTDEQNAVCTPWKALRAHYLKDGQTTEGCYVIRNQKEVRIFWLDFDRDRLPLQIFSKPGEPPKNKPQT